MNRSNCEIHRCGLGRWLFWQEVNIRLRVHTWKWTISWSSTKQPTVALSSTEAKYRGAIIATSKAIWLERLLKDLGKSVNAPYVTISTAYSWHGTWTFTPSLSTSRCTATTAAKDNCAWYQTSTHRHQRTGCGHLPQGHIWVLKSLTLSIALGL
jgi:hypothetical protein